MRAHILIVGGEPAIANPVSTMLRTHGYSATTAKTEADALRLIREMPVNLVVLDDVVGCPNGVGVLASIKAVNPDLPVIMLTEMGCADELRRGAGSRRQIRPGRRPDARTMAGRRRG
ncbi:MAG: response regulator [Verrucomicrobiota bacterium]